MATMKLATDTGMIRLADPRQLVADEGILFVNTYALLRPFFTVGRSAFVKKGSPKGIALQLLPRSFTPSQPLSASKSTYSSTQAHTECIDDLFICALFSGKCLSFWRSFEASFPHEKES